MIRSCAPGMIRTCDTGFRRAVLYPLSYEGGTGWKFTAYVQAAQGLGRADHLPA